MKKLEKSSKKRIHFIGIGGISMSGLAKMLVHDGFKVSGSDIGGDKEIDILKGLGVKIYHSHVEDNISKDVDLVVFTGAVKEDNPELVRARELGIETMERSEFLGLIAREYSKVIAIAGTHGKTTTTAMLGEIFFKANLNPTIHLGGESIGFKGNTIIGGKEYFIVEACEYRESFKYLNPYIGIILNVDLDHLDYYKDYSHIHSAFQNFADNSLSVVCGASCDISHKLIDSVSVINHEGSNWSVKNIECFGGGYSYNVYKNGEYYGSFRLNMIGIHNVYNSLFAISVADKCEIAKDTIMNALSSFKGVERRYERIASINGCNIIIDYAHHPTELKSSIGGISGVYKRVLYVFQPHTYSRTLKLFDEFVEVLSSLSNVVIFKTYPAREKLLSGGTAKDLYNSVRNEFKNYFDDLEELNAFINAKCHEYDCILVLGAGDLALKLKDKYSTSILKC